MGQFNDLRAKYPVFAGQYKGPKQKAWQNFQRISIKVKRMAQEFAIEYKLQSEDIQREGIHYTGN